MNATKKSTGTGKRPLAKSTGSRKKKQKIAKPTKDEKVNEEVAMRMLCRVTMNDLQAIVDKLTRQVNRDWHNGCEKQAVTAGEWFMALQDPIQELLNVGVGKKTALKECNELLKILSTSWKDLLDVGSRVDVKIMLGETCDSLSFHVRVPWSKTPMNISTMAYGYGRLPDLFAYMWNALLRTHASLDETNEGLLLQCIKDAHDNGGEDVTFDGPLSDPWGDDPDQDEPGVPDGKALSSIIKEKEVEWKSLPKTYTY